LAEAVGEFGATAGADGGEELFGGGAMGASAGDQSGLEHFGLIVEGDEAEGIGFGENGEAGGDGLAGLCDGFALHGAGAVEQDDDAARGFGGRAKRGGRKNGGEVARAIVAAAGEDLRGGGSKTSVEDEVAVRDVFFGVQCDRG
jgi:hypothetical protein